VTTLSSSSAASIDAVLKDAVDGHRVPGVVAAVCDRQRIVYEGAFGNAQTARAQPMRFDSVFRMASMTKLLTSVAVLMLVEQGRVELRAPFREYLPAFRQPPVLRSFDWASKRFVATPAARAITVHDLLTHTAGYGYWFLNEEILALMGPAPEHYEAPFLMSEPGSRFRYGISTDVLGRMIEPVSGLALADFFRRRLIEPLGMVDTSFDAPRNPRRLATLHTVVAEGFSEAPNETAGEPPRGGSGLYSTARDYLALLRCLLRDGELDGVRLLEPRSVVALRSNQIGDLYAERQRTALPGRTHDFRFMDGKQKFGLGVLLETQQKSGLRRAGSYGWAGIYNTYFWVDPAAGIAAVLLMQLRPFCTADCFDVGERFERALYSVDGLSNKT
jgi:CubicO group peptidase (beta-lactamase class C family)